MRHILCEPLRLGRETFAAGKTSCISTASWPQCGGTLLLNDAPNPPASSPGAVSGVACSSLSVFVTVRDTRMLFRCMASGLTACSASSSSTNRSQLLAATRSVTSGQGASSQQLWRACGICWGSTMGYACFLCHGWFVLRWNTGCAEIRLQPTLKSTTLRRMRPA